MSLRRYTSGKFGLPVPAVQTGKFADANFCGAQIEDGEKTATFQNGTSLFIITPPSGTIRLTVKSLKQIGTDGQRTGLGKPIYLSENGDTGYSISIPNGPDADKKYYVTLSDGVNLSDLSFEAEYETSGTGAIKGIPTSVIQAQATALDKGYDEYNKIVYGTAYTIDDKNWHDYVTVADHKWATMNVGAEKPEEAGDYFMWSEVRGHKYVSGAWTNFPETNPDESRYNSDLWTPSECFSAKNIPYVTTAQWDELDEGYGYWTYTCSKYNDNTMSLLLSLSDDAANVNWGGAWRMPKGAEYESLITTYEWKNIDGINGMVYGTSPYIVFFPAIGEGQGTELKFSSEPTIRARYWTSESYGTHGGDVHLALGYDKDVIGAEPETALDHNVPRCQGCNVRAIVDEPQSQQEVPVVINTDTDKDGVIDEKDNCPNTPPEAKVDLQGCPLDSDGDGVPDYLDKCLGTSAEAIGKVDELGCPLDSDGDGVPDYLDKCPETPAAAKGYVDANGCPLDSDGDGVYDYEDACPSVAGIKENKGCPEVK